jgi:hypothetical protein
MLFPRHATTAYQQQFGLKEFAAVNYLFFPFTSSVDVF